MRASLGRRVNATLFDLALFGVPYLAAVSSLPPEPVRMAAAFASLAALAAQTVQLAREGRSYGKRRAGLRVVARDTGAAAGAGRAFARAAAAWGPNLLLALAGAMPAWLLIDFLVLWRSAEGLSLHDRIAGTAVQDDGA